MSKSIVITLPHDLGAEKARQRVAERLEMLRRDYVDKIAHSEVNWTGNRADVRVNAFGQVTTAQLDVESESVRIEVRLPWILSALAGPIQSAVSANAEETLKLGKPKS